MSGAELSASEPVRGLSCSPVSRSVAGKNAVGIKGCDIRIRHGEQPAQDLLVVLPQQVCMDRRLVAPFREACRHAGDVELADQPVPNAPHRTALTQCGCAMPSCRLSTGAQEFGSAQGRPRCGDPVTSGQTHPLLWQDLTVNCTRTGLAPLDEMVMFGAG